MYWRRSLGRNHPVTSRYFKRACESFMPAVEVSAAPLSKILRKQWPDVFPSQAGHLLHQKATTFINAEGMCPLKTKAARMLFQS